MPDWMLLKKGGLFRVDYDPETRKYVETNVDDPLVYLRFDCEMSGDFSVADLCDFVYAHPELRAFVARYSQCRAIDEFYAELRNLCPCDDLDAVEIQWRAEVFDHGSENTFSCGPHFCGVRGEENWHGVGFRRLGEIGHLPIRINKDFKIYGYGRGDTPRLSSTKAFSLLDILDAVHWEISFFGGPADRDGVAAEMDEIEGELYQDEPCDNPGNAGGDAGG